MIIRIREPWWGAWKQFGWPKSTWGVGIDSKKIDRAIELNQKLTISIGKLGIFYGDPKIIKLANLTHNAKGKKLFVAGKDMLVKKSESRPEGGFR